MAQRNEQVQDRVREELNRKPDLGSRQLFELVKEMDSSLEGIPLASFHARYVLPVKREQAAQRAQTEASAGEGKKSQPRKQSQRRGKTAEQPEVPAEAAAAAREPAKRSRKQAARTEQTTGGEPTSARQQSEGGGREQIRAVFMEFARAFSEAESRTEIVQVLSKVDEYVERVLQHGR
jgi:hypothetical protein